jgi:uncharacterized SAM-binding protein YcdF (DUF218 family)
VLSRLVREVVLPPGCLLLSGLVILVLLRSRPKAGKIGLGILLVVLYLLSIPLVSISLTNSTHEIPARTLKEVEAFKPQALVVLGGGLYRDAPEYGGEFMVNSSTYKRLAYAAYLAKSLEGVPILVTGGYGEKLEESEGFVAARTLKEWGLETVWMETESENTHQNAEFSKGIAEQHGVSRVALVTSASHAPRAVDEFRKVGFEVLACPTGYRTPTAWEHGVLLVVPTHQYFNESSYALRTHLARVWYWLRY